MKILKDIGIIVSVILLIGVLVFFIFRPNIECRSALNKVEIPFLKAKRGKELVKRIQEEWKIAFDVFLKKNERIELESERSALLKASCYVLLVPKVTIFHEYKIEDSEDQQKINDFNDKCETICEEKLMQFQPKSK